MGISLRLKWRVSGLESLRLPGHPVSLGKISSAGWTVRSYWAQARRTPKEGKLVKTCLWKVSANINSKIRECGLIIDTVVIERTLTFKE